MPTAEPRSLALVTGASSGIGTEIARQLAARGYDIVATGRRLDAVREVETEFARLGVTTYPVVADLSTYDGVEALWADVEALGRPIDIAVLNAGVSIGGPFVDTSLEEELTLIATNIDATVHLAKRVVPAMVAQGRGRILITSSISATMPTPFETVYGPSKAFGYSFAQSLREELRGTGVSVTALLPGATDSEFHVRAGMGNTAIGRSKKNDKRLVAKQGVEALLAGKDHVVGGDIKTRSRAHLNRFLPETFKARWQGRDARS